MKNDMKIIYVLSVCFVFVTNYVFPQSTHNRLKVNVNLAASDYIGFYQKNISQQKNSRCAMYPSCSNYGMQVFKERPFWEAVILTADRLCRCSHDTRFYDVTYEAGYKSYIDYPYYENVPFSVIANRSRIYNVPSVKCRQDRDSTIVFIHQQINKGHYDVALLKIEEGLFEQKLPTDSLYYLKLVCYRGLDLLEEGVFDYETNIDESLKKDGNIGLQIALMYKDLGNVEGAANVLRRNVAVLNDSNLLYRTCLLQAVLDAQQEKWDSSRKNFVQACRYNPEMESMLDRNLLALEKLKSRKRKSPIWAGIFSILPGGGYLYTGHKGSALTSFAINSLLAYATYTSIKTKNYGWAGVCGFLSLSFYIGNINGASRSALRYNQREQKRILGEIENVNNIY